MMKSANTIICLFVMFLFIELRSQNENSQWYFGSSAGLSFLTTPPTILTNGALATSEACASVSDQYGNILFYSDGITVWNQQHLVMANGTGLQGNSSTSQMLAVQRPGSSSLYYVFTLDANPQTGGLKYSIVDMALAAGLGSVTAKNVLVQAPSSEKIAGTRHCNGQDIWILSHDYANNVFRAHLLMSTGLSANAVTSTVGVNSNTWTAGCGQLKFSPNGKRIGMSSTMPGGFEIFDFDNSTGLVSNSIFLGTAGFAYGVEFSPDGTKLYGGKGISSYNATPGHLIQWDLCSGTPAAIVASQYTVSIFPGSLTSFQLAIDRKIYVSQIGTNTMALHVINNPNLLGSACNYSSFGQSLAPNYATVGLPNFLTGNLEYPPFTYTVSTSSCRTASFSPPSTTYSNASCSAATPSTSSIMWIFGDPLSGSTNTSTLQNPTHVFSANGNYFVKMVLNGYCSSDTIVQKITFGNPLSINSTPSVCAGQPATLTVNGASNYTWSVNSNTNASIVVNPIVTSTYTVSSNMGANCSFSTSATIIVAPAPTLMISGPSAVCVGQSATLTASGATNYLWSTTSTQNTVVISPQQTSTYSVSGTSSNNCIGSVIKTITVNALPSLTLSGNFNICKGDKRIYTASGGSTYLWSNSIVTPTVALAPASTTVYTVKAFINGCSAQEQFTVTVNPCTNIERGENSAFFRIFPNPCKDILTIEVAEVCTLILSDMNGSIVQENRLTEGKNEIDLRKISRGTYMYEIKTEANTRRGKIQKTE